MAKVENSRLMHVTANRILSRVAQTYSYAERHKAILQSFSGDIYAHVHDFAEVTA